MILSFLLISMLGSHSSTEPINRRGDKVTRKQLEKFQSALDKWIDKAAQPEQELL